ncbi:MAG: AraC family transcriptional regulator [Lewinella sp.]|nr:AraC family transcriptional regulator [Lewinella sp.]
MYANSDFLDRYTFFLVTYELASLLSFWSLHQLVLCVTKRSSVWTTPTAVLIGTGLVMSFYSGYGLGYWTSASSYYNHWFFDLFNLINMSYMLISAWDGLRAIRKRLAEQAKQIKDHQLLLLLRLSRWLLYFMICRSFAALLQLFVENWFANHPLMVDTLTLAYLLFYNLLLICLLTGVTYFMLRNSVVFAEPTGLKTLNLEQNPVEKVVPKDKPQTAVSTIEVEEMEQFLLILNAKMETERYWLDPKLTQPKLASALNLQPYRLGLVLRHGLGKSFSEYVNAYRIAHAQLLLQAEDEQYTMYAVALESGFASEAPFYSAFRKLVGLSPSAWRKAQNHCQS